MKKEIIFERNFKFTEHYGNASFDKNISIKFIEMVISEYIDKINLDKFLKLADGFILLFDINKNLDEEFKYLNYFANVLKATFTLEHIPSLLIANRIDLIEDENEREIKREIIEEFLQNNDFTSYFEVSCLKGTGVDESLNYLIKYIFKKQFDIEICPNEE